MNINKKHISPKLGGIIRQIVADIIVVEMILTSIGFCGHTHIHWQETGEISRHQAPLFAEISFHLNSESPDHQKSNHDQEKPHHRFHCPCLGGMTGILNQHNYNPAPHFQIFYFEQPVAPVFFYAPLVYHPPLS